jgi:hypothetical protein
VVEMIEQGRSQQWPQTVLFQLTGDRCAQLDQLAVGDQVRVEFSLRGREWRSPAGELKYFNSLDVWRVEPLRAQGGRGRDPRDRDMPPPPAARAEEMYGTPARADDDIPF